MTARFQSTCSVRSKTDNDRVLQRRFYHFNPLAPCGARQQRRSGVRSPKRFQSTCSVRSKTRWSCITCARGRNFNPLAPCGARHGPGRCPYYGMYFNPLAPCGARQWRAALVFSELVNFNPLAPCGARQWTGKMPVLWNVFQSTCSVRSKTCRGI